jgi:hypothetical protein
MLDPSRFARLCAFLEYDEMEIKDVLSKRFGLAESVANSLVSEARRAQQEADIADEHAAIAYRVASDAEWRCDGLRGGKLPGAQ